MNKKMNKNVCINKLKNEVFFDLKSKSNIVSDLAFNISLFFDDEVDLENKLIATINDFELMTNNKLNNFGIKDKFYKNKLIYSDFDNIKKIEIPNKITKDLFVYVTNKEKQYLNSVSIYLASNVNKKTDKVHQISFVFPYDKSIDFSNAVDKINKFSKYLNITSGYASLITKHSEFDTSSYFEPPSFIELAATIFDNKLYNITVKSLISETKNANKEKIIGTKWITILNNELFKGELLEINNSNFKTLKQDNTEKLTLISFFDKPNFVITEDKNSLEFIKFTSLLASSTQTNFTILGLTDEHDYFYRFHNMLSYYTDVICSDEDNLKLFCKSALRKYFTKDIKQVELLFIRDDNVKRFSSEPTLGKEFCNLTITKLNGEESVVKLKKDELNYLSLVSNFLNTFKTNEKINTLIISLDDSNKIKLEKLFKLELPLYEHLFKTLKGTNKEILKAITPNNETLLIDGELRVEGFDSNYNFVNKKTGGVDLSLSLQMKFFFVNSLKKRAEILKITEEYLELTGLEPSFFANSYTGSYKDIINKKLELPYDKFLNNEDPLNYIITSGYRKFDASYYRVYHLGEYEWSDLTEISYMMLDFPVNFFESKQELLEELFFKWSKLLDVTHSNVSLSTVQCDSSRGDYNYYEFEKNLTDKYPYISVGNYITEGIKLKTDYISGVKWLMILSKNHFNKIKYSDIPLIEGLTTLHDDNEFIFVKTSEKSYFDEVPSSYYKLDSVLRSIITDGFYSIHRGGASMLNAYNYQKYINRFNLNFKETDDTKNERELEYFKDKILR